MAGFTIRNDEAMKEPLMVLITMLFFLLALFVLGTANFIAFHVGR